MIKIVAGYLTNNGSVDPGFIDNSYSGGTASSNVTATIDTTEATTDFYPAAYRYERNGACTYTLTSSSITTGTSYILKLHFAEIVYTAAGQRQFNVSVNGVTYLKNFDIVAEAGAANRAIVKTYTVTPNGSGQIIVALSAGNASGVVSTPKISAI